MPRLQRKSFAGPDQVRKFSMGHVDIVNLDETSVGRFVWDPGWRWSEVVKPVVDTPSCVNRHLGYVIGGHLKVQMDDGTELDIVKGDAYEIPPGHDAWVVGDEVFDAVEFASARLFGIAPDEEDERTLATILFTDIVDSTVTLARLGDKAWRRLLLEHNDVLRSELARFRGREIVDTGDGFLALFDGAARAVRCAAAMTDAVRPLGVDIRAGIHTGEVIVAGGNARGVAVHAAARVAGLAGPGEVLVSGTTRDLLDGSGMRFEDRGAHELKGLEGVRQVFALARG
ncbi:MAG TPA: adenylate/guanylate cyclase domain-containing protein [Candidatus Limnocylindrales bacterium]|nr:adenylate/guanylate cyclase domain-containing protein [Candidatus Limnocylindrales bacterium]